MKLQNRFLPNITVAVSVLVLAGRLFHLVDKYAVDILVGDQWVFNDATIFQNHSLTEIFRWQHGPHRQGLGGVLAKLIEPSLHWNSRYEAFGIWAVICLACLAALWLKARLFGKISYIDVLIPLLFFTPIQYEALFGGTSPSHGPLPLLLVIVYCLAWTVESRRWRWGLVIALNFLLIYTGFGLFMGLLTPCLFGLEYYRDHSRLALWGCIVPAFSLASFFIGYRAHSAAGCTVVLENPIHYFLFVGFMLARFIQVYVSHALVAAILVGSLLAFAVMLAAGIFFVKLLRDPSKQTLIVSILLGYSLLFAFGAAYGRMCLGLGAAQGSRYMTYLVLCFFGLYLGALSNGVRFERSLFVGLVFVLASLSSIRIDAVTRDFLEQSSQHRTQWKECYFRSHNIQACDAAIHGYICWQPEPIDLRSKLDFLEEHHLNLYATK